MAPHAVMWSGGKDSALATWRALRRGLELGCLLNFYDAASGRIRFHATRRELIGAQAVRIGMPLRQYGTSWEEFEATFRAALARLRDDGFAGVVLGDIHLADVRAWYEERVRGAGLEHVEPIWGEPPPSLLREIVDSGFRAVVTCCETAKLDGAWLGRIVDPSFAEDIARVPIDPCGENGEYHSFAFAGPLFSEPVPWTAGEVRGEAGFLQLDLLDARDAVALAVDETISLDPALVAAVHARRPKAWGTLAARGVLAYRERAGRAPDDAERRAIWDALWRRAEGFRG